MLRLANWYVTLRTRFESFSSRTIAYYWNHISFCYFASFTNNSRSILATVSIDYILKINLQNKEFHQVFRVKSKFPLQYALLWQISCFSAFMHISHDFICLYTFQIQRNTKALLLKQSHFYCWTETWPWMRFLTVASRFPTVAEIVSQ